MTIKLTDAAKYYKALDHQKKAFEFLQSRLSSSTLKRFAEIYRQTITVSDRSGITWEHPITGKIVSRIISLKFELKPGVAYVVGIRGCDSNLKPKVNTIDKWNDVCGVLYIQKNQVARFIGPYKATTDSGKYYTDNPLNPNGAANVPSNSYNRDVWVRGRHRNQSNCLIQTGAPIILSRDLNRNGYGSDDRTFEAAFVGRH